MKEIEMKTIGILAIGFAGVVGCGASAADERTGASDSAMVTRTVVNRQPDGRETVSVSQVTVAQQQADLEARRASAPTVKQGAGNGSENIGSTTQAISQDTGCGWGSLTLYDGANCTGNYICFYGGTGTVNLLNYCRGSGCTGNWYEATRSYWSGNNTYDPADDGYFTEVSGGISYYEYFTVNGACTNASSSHAAYWSEYVTFTD